MGTTGPTIGGGAMTSLVAGKSPSEDAPGCRFTANRAAGPSAESTPCGAFDPMDLQRATYQYL
jgi:hypothetical protein